MIRVIATGFISLSLAACVSSDRSDRTDFLALASTSEEPISNPIQVNPEIKQPISISAPAVEDVRVIDVSIRGEPRHDHESYSFIDMKYRGNLTGIDRDRSKDLGFELLSYEILRNKQLDPDAGGDVFIYVHGFNNSDNDALERAAQVSGYLARHNGFHGTTIAFSWQSGDALKKYLYDLQSSNFARDALSRLLYRLAKIDGVGRINIVAHSMGTWLTMEALRQTAIIGADRKVVFDRIAKVNLVDADDDSDVFSKQLETIVDNYKPTNWFGNPIGPTFDARVRVFANPNDKALEFAGWGSGAPRLGNLSSDQIRDFNNKNRYNINYTSTIDARTQKVKLTYRNIINRAGQYVKNFDKANWATQHWPLFDHDYTGIVAVDVPPDTQNTSQKALAGGN